MRKKLPLVMLATITLGAGSLTSYAQSDVSDIGADLAVIRQSTAKYHRVEKAVADGYEFIVPGGNPGGPDVFYVSLAALYDGPPESGGIPGVLRLDQPAVMAYVKLPNG